MTMNDLRELAPGAALLWRNTERSRPFNRPCTLVRLTAKRVIVEWSYGQATVDPRNLCLREAA